MSYFNQVLKYKYNRNNYEFVTNEEFFPDSDNTWHELSIAMQKIIVNGEVKNSDALLKNCIELCFLNLDQINCPKEVSLLL